MTDFDAHTRANCIRILLDGMADTQRAHAAGFLLAEVERLYLAGRIPPPVWIAELRAADWREPPQPRPAT